MKAKELIDSIRHEFLHRISAKTGWGRIEVMVEFERAVTDAVSKTILLSEYPDLGFDGENLPF